MINITSIGNPGNIYILQEKNSHFKSWMQPVHTTPTGLL